jgi:hypothetical protein
MPYADPADPAALAAAAEALGRQARRERAPLDTLLARVESMAADLAGRDPARPAADLYAPERDAALLHLWRTAWHAYEAGPAEAA